jgi:hypothetical protein
VELAPAAALHDLGTLVLGDHALDLQQQVEAYFQESRSCTTRRNVYPLCAG